MGPKTPDSLSLAGIFHASSEDNFFELSLSMSLLLHVFIFACLFYANVHYDKKVHKNLEVIYQIQARDLKTDKVPNVRAVRSVKPKRELLQPSILNKGNAALPIPFQETGKDTSRFGAQKKILEKAPFVERKKYVSVPVLDSEKISSPRYLDYHERIRNKIKNRAYLYVDNPQFEKGEVYLTFVLSSDGGLKQIKILDDRTSANDYLKNVGLRSIKESNPFPPFPKELEYPELSFNVVISFEINN